MFTLLINASLRFCDIRDVSDLWTTAAEIVGRSLNSKDKAGALMTWAVPLWDLFTKGAWTCSLIAYWDTAKPDTNDPNNPSFMFLFPYFSKGWDINFPRAATNGGAQACFNQLEKVFGLKTGRTLRPPRTWFATCANRLASKREVREKLGRWSAGSLMPGRYDRATCATELRLRSDIVNKVADGRRPQGAFGIPGKKKMRKRGERREIRIVYCVHIVYIHRLVSTHRG